MVDNDELQGSPRAQPTSLGLGERLRSARKARALSVAQVAEALHLEEASVVALEEGRFEVLGAPVFVRGHLKRYAALVGLSNETVLEAYRAAAPGSDAPPMIARARLQSDAMPVAPWVWWLVAAVVLVGAMIAFSNGDEEQAPASMQSLPAPDPAAVTTIPLPADAADATGAVPAPDAPPPAAGGTPPGN